MRSLLILVAICFSATAFAQSAPQKVGNKSLVQVKPKEPMGCKLVGTVKGTKLWAGDCVASGLRGAAPATETNLPVAAAGQSRPVRNSDWARPFRDCLICRFDNSPPWGNVAHAVTVLGVLAFT